MKKLLKFALIAMLVLSICVTLIACLPAIATDKTIIGIVDDGVEHTDFPEFRGYRYGNETEKYNLNFRLGLPKNYDANKKYPLVVFLHFLGAQGVDNEAQMQHYFIDNIQASETECIVFLPQLASEKMSFSANFYNSKDLSSLYNACLDEVIKTYAVDTDRLYVTGVSMGAHNIWELIAKEPTKYAAAMPVSFGTSKDKAEAVKNVPILMAHSVDDDVVDVSTSQEIYNALTSIGGNVKYKEYASGGHGTCFQFYQEPEVWQWLFEQSK